MSYFTISYNSCDEKLHLHLKLHFCKRFLNFLSPREKLTLTERFQKCFYCIDEQQTNKLTQHILQPRVSSRAYEKGVPTTYLYRQAAMHSSCQLTAYRSRIARFRTTEQQRRFEYESIKTVNKQSYSTFQFPYYE